MKCSHSFVTEDARASCTRRVGVKQWVEAVHVSVISFVVFMGTDHFRLTYLMKRLRYKDYQRVVRPSPLVVETQLRDKSVSTTDERRVPMVIHEVETVKDLGAVMRQRNVWSWWRKGMGYVSGHE